MIILFVITDKNSQVLYHFPYGSGGLVLPVSLGYRDPAQDGLFCRALQPGGGNVPHNEPWKVQ